MTADGDIDLGNLTPEQQKIFDAAYAKGAAKVEGQLKDLETKYHEAAKKLSSAEESANLTKEERDALKKQVTDFEEKYLTAEQKSQKTVNELRTQYDSQLKAKEAEATHWRTRHDSRLIESTLTDAAVAGDAYIPSQVVQLLRPAVQLEERMEDGKGTGEYEIKIKGKDKDGKPILFDVEEGVKNFLDSNPNLVKSKVVRKPGDGKLDSIVTAKGTVITADQLEDAKFVNEHWDEIKAAIKAGNLKTR